MFLEDATSEIKKAMESDKKDKAVMALELVEVMRTIVRQEKSKLEEK